MRIGPRRLASRIDGIGCADWLARARRGAMLAELTETAWTKLRTLMPVESELRARTQVQVSVGQFVDEIGRARTTLNADVVVMGVMPRGVLGRWLGSSTSQILRAIKTPLIAVPESLQTAGRAFLSSPATFPATLVEQATWGTARIA